MAALVWLAAIAYDGRVPLYPNAAWNPTKLLPRELLPALLLGCSPSPAAPTTTEGGAPSPSSPPTISSKPSAPAPSALAPTPAENPSAPAPAGASLVVTEAVAQHPVEGSLTVTGHAAKVLTCPPCPPDAICKPCMGDNVVLSDEKMPITSYRDLGPRVMVIFGDTAEVERHHLGQRYRATVEVRATHRTSAPYNDLWLTHADPAP